MGQMMRMYWRREYFGFVTDYESKQPDHSLKEMLLGE
jgi:hypothetical protein